MALTWEVVNIVLLMTVGDYSSANPGHVLQPSMSCTVKRSVSYQVHVVASSVCRDTCLRCNRPIAEMASFG